MRLFPVYNGLLSGDDMEEVTELDKRLTTHEAVCELRWRETILRIKRIEAIMISSAGAIILLLIHLITKS